MASISTSRKLLAMRLSQSVLRTRAQRTFVPGARPAATALPTTASTQMSQRRFASSNSSVDAIIEDIQEQYATAKDEFEIAQEETEKMTVYAEEDRGAAREELDKLQNMYKKALQGAGGEEIQQRIGQRIRELDNAVKAMEELAQNQD